MPENEKNAVILAGGGAYAAWEVGVIQGLIEGRSQGTNFEPLYPDIYTGTSGGAINAAILAGEPTPTQGVDRLKSVWLNTISNTMDGNGNGVFRVRFNPFDLLDPRRLFLNPAKQVEQVLEDLQFTATDTLARGVKLLQSEDSIAQRFAELFDVASLISTVKFRDAAKSFLRLDAIRQSPSELRVVVTDWESGTAKTFDNRDFTEQNGVNIILDAASIPGIFPMHGLNDALLVDGTIVENTPLMPAIDLGADTVHVIEPPSPKDFPPSPTSSLAESFYRTIVISLSTLLERDLQRAARRNRDLEILDSVSKAGGLSGFTRDEVAQAMFRTTGRDPEMSYRKITVHRYKPTHHFGFLGGLLDFRQREIQRSIDAGYQVALNHNCDECGCLTTGLNS